MYEDDQAQKEIDECGACYVWVHTGFCVGKTRYLFAGWSKRLDIDQFLEGSEESIVCFAQLTLLEFRYSFTISDCKATKYRTI